MFIDDTEFFQSPRDARKARITNYLRGSRMTETWEMDEVTTRDLHKQIGELLARWDQEDQGA
ncbi:hypothetical protein [Streptomyces rimosus]|uniref:hypothetical protein n=1 Tax=Streptomyces rimosus TaxID=1927 RepID=UPI0004BE6615|nr:hypothetical protein [Streptomyces rimosus]